MMHGAFGVFAGGISAWGLCLGVSAGFFKYAANLLDCGVFGVPWPSRIEVSHKGTLDDTRRHRRPTVSYATMLTQGAMNSTTTNGAIFENTYPFKTAQ